MSEQIPTDQQVRIKAMELTIDHFRGATSGGNYLEPPQLITRAEQLEEYIIKGAASEPTK